MLAILQKAHIAGVERLAAWSDVLDDINVYPVADGDTGRNLIASLTPLRYPANNRDNIIRRLLISARGNSGNIAVWFLAGFLKADSFEHFRRAANSGRNQAWQAVDKPVAGTMLTVFDALVNFLETNAFEANSRYVTRLTASLAEAVKSTHQLLPPLRRAGVVDAGALGMYIFLDGFFKALIDRTDTFQPIATAFSGMLKIAPSFDVDQQEGYCVDTLIRVVDRDEEKISRISRLAESVTAMAHHDYLKIHLHTRDARKTREQMETLGDVIQWSDDNLGIQTRDFKRPVQQGAIHIMTDAAGSVTRTNSRQLGITLLDSYISVGDKSLPETLFTAAELYAAMRQGQKVSTSQASVFERHQYYQRLINQYAHVLYLCVGSVYTGNYEVAMAWKQQHDPDDRFAVIDTAAASGRLAMIVMSTARYAANTSDPQAVIDFAQRSIAKCEEYVFLDKLKYLAAGGRLSKSSAFFGDMLNVKPIISPLAEGAKKVGAVKNRKGQLQFALEKLAVSFSRNARPFIMLEYSDNRHWVAQTAKKTIAKRFPSAEILLQPLSLTSGAHMGPGTWAVAFLPENV